MHADDSALPRLPTRDAAGHKGTFGRVAVVGGCAAHPRMIGGPALAAIAALRAGAGLVRLVMPEPVLTAGLTVAPSATGAAIGVGEDDQIEPHEAARALDEALEGCDCLAIGPGLGSGGAGARAICLRAVMQQERPAVVDADALNNLAATPGLRHDFRAAAVLTPHPGEFERLSTSLGLGLGTGAATDEAARPAACAALAQTLGCVVVLKGAPTVVSDGHRTWINVGDGARNPTLATAGTGDVLTGLIAALIAHAGARGSRGEDLRALAAAALRARGMGHHAPADAAHRADQGLSLYDCARLGVRAHAIAGLAWSRASGASGGMLALDLAAHIPAAVESLRR